MTKPIPIIYHRIGVRISHARQDAGLLQSDLAEETGLTRTSISNIEAGKQGIQIDTLYAIARVLDITVDKLLPATSDPADYDGWLKTYEEDDTPAPSRQPQRRRRYGTYILIEKGNV